MFRPFRLVFLAEVAGEGFSAPVTVARIGDGSECGDGFVGAWVFEELTQLLIVSERQVK